ncbi:MAG: SH3 domain-containing protein [Defluviitaleaceae bacterium]|nr:SH3 domain-containing protein [Defluviitaleaceae bacterium]
MKTKVFLVGLLLTLLFLPVTVSAGIMGEYEDSGHIGLGILEPTTFVTTSRLNLRPSPCTSGTRLAVVPQGRQVEVLNFGCGDWYEVDFNGTVGFMYAAHLREATDTDVMFSIGPVELLYWSEARNVMTYGTVATIVDVRTGATWEVASFSNGRHADVEPITAEDTAIMLNAFGGRWCWTPRPVLVIINGRTLAASINGMPHAGSTRSGNNMNGHVCLHFRGSSTHRSAPSHVRDHQNAITEAYNTASGWHTPDSNEYIL